MSWSALSVGRTFPPRTYSPTFPRPDNFPPHLGHSQAVKAKIWKLALTYTPNPNRPATWSFDPNSNSIPNRLTGRGIFWKLALTCISDSNRSTTINFTDVNGRSLYVVDWRMVVVKGGECPTPCKREGELSGREMSGENTSGWNGRYMSEGECTGGMSGSLRVVSKTNRRHGRGGVCFHRHNFKWLRHQTFILHYAPVYSLATLWLYCWPIRFASYMRYLPTSVRPLSVPWSYLKI